jgi:hypothetical protein
VGVHGDGSDTGRVRFSVRAPITVSVINIDDVDVSSVSGHVSYHASDHVHQPSCARSDVDVNTDLCTLIGTSILMSVLMQERISRPNSLLSSSN